MIYELQLETFENSPLFKLKGEWYIKVFISCIGDWFCCYKGVIFNGFSY